MGGHHGSFLSNREVQVVALCDVESVRLGIQKQRAIDAYTETFGKDAGYEGIDAYSDFRDLCARQDIDAVVNATPNHWHSLVAIEAMRNGKDVYSEKPLARTINEGKAMRTAARHYGRVFQTGSQQRSSREFRIACELVRNGRIGKLHTIHVNVGGPPVDCYLPEEPVPEGLDWNFWLGPAPYRPYHSDIAPPHTYEGWPNWRSYRDYAGGMMTDWGAHHFDIAQWGLDRDGSGPCEVHPPDGQDYPYLTYKYDNGVVMYHGGAFGNAGVEFIGDQGKVRVNRGWFETEPAEIAQEVIGPGEIHLYDSPGHHENWLECIKTRRKPICDIEIGHRSATVCHIGNICYWLKRALQWDPVTEQFDGDDDANRLLQRPMRSPWRI
ncbi:MAG: hypothetical protein AMXMBFR84_17170 [Candidatus Hydrogenedentota bacterium]